MVCEQLPLGVYDMMTIILHVMSPIGVAHIMACYVKCVVSYQCVYLTSWLAMLHVVWSVVVSHIITSCVKCFVVCYKCVYLTSWPLYYMLCVLNNRVY